MYYFKFEVGGKVCLESGSNLSVRLCLGTDAILALLSTSVTVGDGRVFIRWGLLGGSLDALEVLFGDKTLEPLVLHLELTNTSFKELHLVGHLLGRLLQSLLALLLLDTESSTSGGVSATLVLLSSEA